MASCVVCVGMNFLHEFVLVARHQCVAGPEYGTNKAILLGSLNEAESLADVHNSVRDKLAEVQTDVKKWKHDTYKKQMVGGCKEAKAFEDEFRKVFGQIFLTFKSAVSKVIL